MIANSAMDNEKIGTASIDDTETDKSFANDKPEQSNPDNMRDDNWKMNVEDGNAMKDDDPIGSEDNSKKEDDTENSGRKIDENYFSVGHFLKEDGTSEEVMLHVSEIALGSDDDEDDGGFDPKNPPHHFAEDGSVQKLDLSKKPKTKKKVLDLYDKMKTFSLGNFLKRDGTLEEVRIPFDELDSDSDEDLHEGISTTYHLGEDGSLQTLIGEKLGDKKETNEDIGENYLSLGHLVKEDGRSEEVALPASEGKSLQTILDEQSNNKNQSNDKNKINEKIVTDGKNPFYGNDLSFDKNPFNEENSSDDKNTPDVKNTLCDKEYLLSK